MYVSHLLPKRSVEYRNEIYNPDSRSTVINVALSSSYKYARTDVPTTGFLLRSLWFPSDETLNPTVLTISWMWKILCYLSPVCMHILMFESLHNWTLRRSLWFPSDKKPKP
jgi:hypothetical protein